MSVESKVPLERRRRNHLWEGMLGILTNGRIVPMRRESDLVRSRMQRWVELADRALVYFGKFSRQRLQAVIPLIDLTRDATYAG